jgi:hypothetical protein
MHGGERQESNNKNRGVLKLITLVWLYAKEYSTPYIISSTQHFFLKEKIE